VLVKLQSFFLGNARQRKDGSAAGQGSELLARLGVPVLQPVVSSHLSPEEWAESTQGLGADIAWSVALPEFEGVIEPLLLGAMQRREDPETRVLLEERVPVPERCRKLARRVLGWARLRRTPRAERKVSFILHNNPCASVEASVGGAANLDSLESVARILAAMRDAGYAVTPPESGKELIETIMARKAISEFRWTTVEEIVAKGGALTLLPLEEYGRWWREFPPQVRERVAGVWGDPPGQAKDGVPPAMVHDGRIVVTGVAYGNATVGVQPKRGCAGPRCRPTRRG
jgi:cobaltochelatase CobN